MVLVSVGVSLPGVGHRPGTLPSARPVTLGRLLQARRS